MTDVEKYKKYAEKIALFNGLSPLEISDIIHKGETLKLQKGKTIFHAGQMGRTIFIIFRGEVDIYLEDTRIAECKVGEVFGEISVLDNRPHTATAVARTDVKLLTLDEDQINQLLEQRVAVRFLLNVIHVLTGHLVRMNTMVNRLEHQLRVLDPSAPGDG